MMLIGLAGKARSGKDTAAGYLVEAFALHQYAFAKPLKEAARVAFGLNDEQLYGDLKETVDQRYGVSPRVILQRFGTDFGRQMVNPDVWLIRAQVELDGVKDVLNAMADSGLTLTELEAVKFPAVRGMVVSDVRFDNEAQWIRDNGGLVIHISRPDAAVVAEHASEAGLVFHGNDIEVVNNGTIEDLHQRVGFAVGMHFSLGELV